MKLRNEQKQPYLGLVFYLPIIWKNERKRMSKYTVVLSKKAQKQLDKLSDNVAQPIFEAILNLEDNLSFYELLLL